MMSFKSKQGEGLDGLQDLHQSGLVLTANAIAKGCARAPVLSRTRKVSRIGRLIEAAAWTDAALALIELELPQWETSSTRIRQWGVVLLAFQAAGPVCGIRRDRRRESRNAASCNLARRSLLLFLATRVATRAET